MSEHKLDFWAVDELLDHKGFSFARSLTIRMPSAVAQLEPYLGAIASQHIQSVPRFAKFSVGGRVGQAGQHVSTISQSGHIRSPRRSKSLPVLTIMMSDLTPGRCYA